jgi:MOSC domain-containing protein YiiM
MGVNHLLNADSRAAVRGVSGPVQVEHLFISPGHNFFGHHGGPAGAHPTVAQEKIECVAGRGIRGDRFFDFKPDYKGQITFFSMEVFEQLCRELRIPDARPDAMRRNVLVRGLDLMALVNRRFEVQGTRFIGVEESRPCDWMNLALAPGARDWLRGRAGLRCRIITDGVLKVGPATFATVD